MRRRSLAPLAAVPVLLAALAVAPPDAAGQQKKAKKAEPKAPARPQSATPPEMLKTAKGFKVELLYSVPKDQQGSWVNLCVDPKGRLITSDQYGPLYRITPPPVGGPASETKVEQIKADIGGAQGMCYAFGALYVVVNAQKPKSGLYRVTDTDGDDMPDKVELLRAFDGGGGEHGPHAVIPHPDGKRLTVVCGNQTKMVKYDTTRVPPVWGEDHLLPRLPDGNGFMRGVLGPGGAIYNVTPDGKAWELFSVGFRNQFDAAYNRAGDLFTYDADMEWDFNTPWYRPTRVCLVSSGSEYGWRNGAGKYPPYYPDNLPGVCDIGPGSPTGTCFGYGAKFPEKYQNAYFICDWSYGKLYAVHLAPDKSAYKGTAEEFITGTPLPLTDVVVNPHDGAMYFTVGGRKTQSGLYRVTYAGPEPTAPAKAEPVPDTAPVPYRKLRAAMESAHHPGATTSPDEILPVLMAADRFARFAARVALEHQPADRWREKALAESDPTAAANALLALVRVSAADPFHAKPDSPKGDPALRAKIVAKLNGFDFGTLTVPQQQELLRVYHVLFNRFGPPTPAERSAVLAKFEGTFPTPNRWVNADLGQLLVYLEAPSIGAKMVKHMLSAPTQEEQIEYLRSLRCLKTGWTPELRAAYFEMFVKAAGFRGGNSLRGFMKLMRDDAWANVPPAERPAVQKIIDRIPTGTAVAETGPARPFVKKYGMDDLLPKLEASVTTGGRDFDRGRKLFAEARCFGCHRFDGDGSSFGPDLSGLAGRFGPKDLLESVLDPSKEVSDQYAAVEIETESGKVVVGRIINLHGDNVQVNTNMLDPNAITSVNRNDVASMKPAKQSMMPAGLLDVLKEDEALDLMAYLLSRGDRTAPLFKK
jgi:putative heme-binding domain-containing protein